MDPSTDAQHRKLIIQHNTLVRRLRRIQRVESVIRTLCLVSTLSVFHAASCLNAQRPLPMATRLGCIAFTAGFTTVAVLAKKRDRYEDDCRQIREQLYSRSREGN